MLSLRGIKRIADSIKAGDTIQEALRYGFYNCALLTASEKERDTLESIAKVVFGAEHF